MVYNTIQKYNNFSKEVKNQSQFTFMNYGFVNLNSYNYPLSPKKIKPLHYNEYYQANLYLELLKLNNINKGSILDISCGRGGGTSVYKEYFNFDKIVGVDINSKNLKFASNKFSDIKFIKSDAINLPFPKSSFDIVTNVEALGYYYKDLEVFIKGVHKILKNKGKFLLAHCHHKSTANETFTNIINICSSNNLKLIKEKDITKNSQIATLLYSNLFLSLDPYRALAQEAGHNMMLESFYKMFLFEKI